MKAIFLLVGVMTLGVAWFVPWHELLPGPFSVHMTRHIGLVAIAAPCIAAGVAGGRFDPVRRWPILFPPVAASLLELVVVWTWHAPLVHHAAQHSGLVRSVEQSSFILVGLFVWMAALGGNSAQRPERSATGLIALLLTLMHMTLLGALLGLAPRPLYADAGAAPLSAVLADQHLGGAIMLTVGSASYLLGGLWLAAELLRSRSISAASRRLTIDRAIAAGPGPVA